MSTEYNNEPLISDAGLEAALIQYDQSFAAVAVSGDYNDLANKPTIPTVPTNVSELTNDSGYQNAAQVDAAIDAKTTSPFVYKGSVPTLNDLPSGANIGDTYYVESEDADYIWTGSKWSPFGTSVDLSAYAKTEFTEATYSKLGHKHAASDITSGTLALARGGTGTDNSTGRAANTVFVAPDGSDGAASWRKLKNGDIPILIPEKLPIVPLAKGGTAVDNTARAINTVFAGPSSGNAGNASWRKLVPADIPNLDASKITTGTLSRARGGTGQSGVTSLSGSGVITINSTNATLVSAYAKIWGPVANVFVRFKTKKDISVSASGGFTDFAIGTIPSSLIPHTIQHGITDNINAVRFSVNDGNSTIYLTGAATWSQAYTIASGTQFNVSITYMLKNVN